MHPADAPGDGAPLDSSPGAPVDTLVANHRRFLDFLTRRVGSREDAEDILQEAFVRSLERIDQVRAPEAVTAWFYRLLRNAIADHYRRLGTETRAAAQYAGREDQAVPPVDDDLFAAVCECVTRLIPGLRPDYQEALRRVDLDGAAVAAYASEAGITANNAGVRLHRAREALRRELARCCGTCVDHGCLDCRCGGPAGHSA